MCVCVCVDFHSISYHEVHVCCIIHVHSVSVELLSYILSILFTNEAR